MLSWKSVYDFRVYSIGYLCCFLLRKSESSDVNAEFKLLLYSEISLKLNKKLSPQFVTFFVLFFLGFYPDFSWCIMDIFSTVRI